MPDSDFVYCDKYASQKRAKAQELDPQVAMLLLRQCGSFCKMVHLACSTPPSLMADALQMFDNDIHEAFAECTAVDGKRPNSLLAEVGWIYVAFHTKQ